jgi:flagellar hook-basal body complex protein FliE
MSTIDTGSLMAMRNAILQQNSALHNAWARFVSPAAGGATKAGGFAGTLSSVLSNVNTMDQKAGAATEAYERGETTDIAAVMLSREQASVSFQATLQVRNKLLAAYKDIMSMPV